MPRENAQAKATRLLVEGRVSVVRVDQRGALAIVKGDTGLHRVTYNGSWHCDCAALGMCSHGLACARVVVPPGAWLVAADVLVRAGSAPLDRRERRLSGMNA
jgi:hypothetical protein